MLKYKKTKMIILNKQLISNIYNNYVIKYKNNS